MYVHIYMYITCSFGKISTSRKSFRSLLASVASRSSCEAVLKLVQYSVYWENSFS